MTNRLARERSQYLLQHRDNPVDWYPWGDEAFERARQEDRPVLLSIGYSACHWCHVMEHESFSDPQVADFMNDHFVSVKVDREEHPAIDTIYMAAVQRMTGHGGWPLTAFLLPSGEPFYGGTYFPPEPRHGMPSFRQVLEAISSAWNDRREEVVRSAGTLTEELRNGTRLRSSRPGLIDRSALDRAAGAIASRFDLDRGGAEGAPKFPQPVIVDYLLRRSGAAGAGEARRAADATLRGMAAGGMHDHLAGGFHRYSVDADWTVPHFEKMTYDNAQLALLYLRGWQVLGEPAYLRVAESTCEHLIRDMRTADGLFASSVDADSEGEEGRYYVWSPAEIDAALDDEEAAFTRDWFGVTQGGNFEGANILRADPARWPPPEENAGRLDRIRPILLERRSGRPAPDRDDKAVLAWNGMVVVALAEIGRAVRPELVDEAYVTGEAMAEGFRSNGDWQRVVAGRVAYIPAHLEDLAWAGEAFLALFRAGGRARWLELAREVAGALIDGFWDDEEGIFYDAPLVGTGPAVVRARDVFDGATPSGSSSAAMLLTRLGRLVDDERCLEIAERTCASMRELIDRAPSAVCRTLAALDELTSPRREVVLAEGSDADSRRRMREALGRRYLPGVSVVHVDAEVPAEQRADLPLLAGRGAADGRSTAFLCEHFSCRAPIAEVDALEEALDRWSGPG